MKTIRMLASVARSFENHASQSLHRRACRPSLRIQKKQKIEAASVPATEYRVSRARAGRMASRPIRAGERHRPAPAGKGCGTASIARSFGRHPKSREILEEENRGDQEDDGDQRPLNGRGHVVNRRQRHSQQTGQQRGQMESAPAPGSGVGVGWAQNRIKTRARGRGPFVHIRTIGGLASKLQRGGQWSTVRTAPTDRYFR